MTTARARPPDTLAPWAEIAHGARRMSMAAFLDCPGDDGYRYELVEGVLVRMVGSRRRANRITDRLYRGLGGVVEAHHLGQTTPPDAV